MNDDDQAGRLFRDGRLDDAIEEAGRAVRRTPTALGARLLLAELLLFSGGLERADAILLAADAIDPTAALVVAEFRQLLRAAAARRQLITEGRVPEFLGGPSTAQGHALEAVAALRAGDRAAASVAADAAEAARPASIGTKTGTGDPFADFRDADDLCGGSFEVLTTTGKYYWVPIERVDSVEFHPARRPRDLFWRRCTMDVRNGPDGDVYMPALYETTATLDDAFRLGRATGWSDDAPVRGLGQRIFLAGDEAVPIGQLQSLVLG